jgi:prolyl oligopeptidase
MPYQRLTNKGPLFYARTNLSAPQYKVVTIDIANGNRMKDLIPESDTSLLKNFQTLVSYYEAHIK